MQDHTLSRLGSNLNIVIVIKEQREEVCVCFDPLHNKDRGNRRRKDFHKGKTARNKHTGDYMQMCS